MRLRHLSLPSLTPYQRASELQSHLVAAFLAHKSSPHPTAAPDPVVITAQFPPVYTCGRREIAGISAAQVAHLTAATPRGRAAFHPALRGGQTTFHGPGQLVAYPVLDLRRHGLTARSYVCALEKSVIAVCARHGVATRTTEDPGVWARPDAKICAVGVHLRRHVSSHGIGLNVHTDLGWFERIVACGLEGKSTTSLEREGSGGLTVEEVGEEFVRTLSERLEGVDEVVKMEVDEVINMGVGSGKG